MEPLAPCLGGPSFCGPPVEFPKVLRRKRRKKNDVNTTTGAVAMMSADNSNNNAAQDGLVTFYSPVARCTRAALAATVYNISPQPSEAVKAGIGRRTNKSFTIPWPLIQGKHLSPLSDGDDDNNLVAVSPAESPSAYTHSRMFLRFVGWLVGWLFHVD